tara:strand:- start:4449 stop:4916 length:468 start_codon:yes stop_codon:yes gene_type:complete
MIDIEKEIRKISTEYGMILKDPIIPNELGIDINIFSIIPVEVLQLKEGPINKELLWFRFLWFKYSLVTGWRVDYVIIPHPQALPVFIEDFGEILDKEDIDRVCQRYLHQELASYGTQNMARAKDKCFSYMDVTKKMAIKAGDILFTEKSPLIMDT